MEHIGTKIPFLLSSTPPPPPPPSLSSTASLPRLPLFPLDRCRRLGGDVIAYAVDPADLRKGQVRLEIGSNTNVDEIG